jgi:hypothetical protein
VAKSGDNHPRMPVFRVQTPLLNARLRAERCFGGAPCRFRPGPATGHALPGWGNHEPTKDTLTHTRHRLLALFVALSGVAYAAATIGSDEIIDGSIRNRDFKDG